MENTIYFREIAKQWQKEKEPFVKRSTFAIYGIHLKTHLIPAFGNTTSVWETDVQRLVNRAFTNLPASPKSLKTPQKRPTLSVTFRCPASSCVS